MKIRTKLFLNAMLPLGTALAIAVLLFFSMVREREASRRAETAEALSEKAFELNYYTVYYLLHQQPQTRDEWYSIYDSMLPLIPGASVENSDQNAAAARIATNYKEIRELFEERVGAGQDSGSQSLNKEMQANLTSRMLINARNIWDDALLLHNMSDRDRNYYSTRTKILTVGMILFSALVTAATLFLVNRGIAAAINKLIRGAAQVGSGKLDHKIELQTDDELGQLAKAFGNMTVNLRAVTVSRDELAKEIADRRRAENEIERLNEELRQKVAELENSVGELDAFSYSVSHDLRAPLRIIEGFSRIVLKEYQSKLDEKGKEFLQLMIDNVIRMNSLIDALLELSRVGRHELTAADVDIGRMVREIFDELTSLAPDRKFRLDVKEMPPAKGDEILIRLVISNLLSNAIKFTSGKELSVLEIGGKKDNDENVYYVRDNGIGFDMKYADKLYNVFQRLHGKTEFEGTGIGLSIVHRVIKRHGGRVWAESKPDEGATFYFALPE